MVRPPKCKRSGVLAGVLLVLIALALGLASDAEAARYRITHVHNDHLGRPIAGTDEAGQVVWSVGYGPFGVVAWSNGEVPEIAGFPGQYRDGLGGAYYNYHRWYDPVTGRYITADPIGLKGGLNPYQYANGNPARFVDPNGLQVLPWPIIPGAGAGASAGGAAASRGQPYGEIGPHSPWLPKEMRDFGRNISSWYLCFTLGYCLSNEEASADDSNCPPSDGADSAENPPKKRGKETIPPYHGPPDGYVEGPRRGREYGADGKPKRDYDKPHQGAEYPHVHEWIDGKREHPGRPYSPLPRD